MIGAVLLSFFAGRGGKAFAGRDLFAAGCGRRLSGIPAHKKKAVAGQTLGAAVRRHGNVRGAADLVGLPHEGGYGEIWRSDHCGELGADRRGTGLVRAVRMGGKRSYGEHRPADLVRRFPDTDFLCGSGAVPYTAE